MPQKRHQPIVSFCQPTVADVFPVAKKSRNAHFGTFDIPYRLGVEKLLVDSLNSLLAVLLVDEDGDLDLRGGDHADVDILRAEGGEDLARRARAEGHLSADDGESTYHIADNLYIMDITGVPYTGLVNGTEPVKETPWSVKTDANGKVVKRTGLVAGGAAAGRVELFREMTDFRRAGEIEGVCIDPVTQDLLVLNNRGTQIILGMSQGPFKDEGYTKEIHEVYIYEKIK